MWQQAHVRPERGFESSDLVPSLLRWNLTAENRQADTVTLFFAERTHGVKGSR